MGPSTALECVVGAGDFLGALLGQLAQLWAEVADQVGMILPNQLLISRFDLTARRLRADA